MLGGCMLIRPPLGSNSVDVSIYGITLRNGKGTKVVINSQEKKYGGGVFVYKGNNVIIKHNKFENNGGISSINKGGALVLSDSDDIGFDDRSYNNNDAPNDREFFDISNNTFNDNYANIAKSVYIDYVNQSVDMTNGFYDVYDCENDFVTPYWIFGDTGVTFDFSNSDGEICTISNDIWVSPSGSNNNNGTQDSPFQTITYAISVAAQVENDPTTIHLGAGTYSPTYECGAGEVIDCGGNCSPESSLGNDFCDSSVLEHNGNPINFNCEEFQFDNGDCYEWDYCSEIEISWINDSACIEFSDGYSSDIDFNAIFVLFQDNCLKTGVYITNLSTGEEYNFIDQQIQYEYYAYGFEPNTNYSIQFESNGIFSETINLAIGDQCSAEWECSNIYDCNGNCLSLVLDFWPSPLGDGNCQNNDNIDLDCSTWNYDFGDCGNENSSCQDCINDYTDNGSECCDTAWEEYGISCSELESNYGWDCTGCGCPGDENGGNCEDSYVDDCSGDGDCCLESWIGDSYCDGTDQQYGCDLTCYENDGGDCEDSEVSCGNGICESSESFDNCPEDCSGGGTACEDCEYDFTNYGSECCDTAWGEFSISCSDLENDYGWDCTGCACPGDSGTGSCVDGNVEDCSGDGDCCSETWIGDGYCDGTDQQWGCDLTCYDNDGGDCGTRNSQPNDLLSLKPLKSYYNYISLRNDFNIIKSKPEPISDNFVSIDKFKVEIEARINKRNINQLSNYSQQNVNNTRNIFEVFPIQMLDWINIQGSGADETILDAEEITGILDFINVDNCEVSDLTITNGKREWGGGMYIENSSPNFSNVIISNNQACLVGSNNFCLGGGGGAYIAYNSNPYFNNVQIINNISGNAPYDPNQSATQGRGAGLYINDNCNVTIENSTINHNQSGNDGAGLHISGGITQIIDSDISYNYASGQSGVGGAISIFSGFQEQYETELIIEGSILSYNQADWWGGAIAAYNTTIDDEFISANIFIGDSKVHNNKADFKGSAIFASNLTLNNVDVYNNEIIDGAATIWIRKQAKIINSTIVGNYGDVGGGSVWVEHEDDFTFDISEVIIVNSILWNNSPSEIVLQSGGGNRAIISNSNIQDGENGIINNNNNNEIIWQNGNIDIDPLFVDSNDSNYDLQENSPCIDAGTSDFSWNGEVIINLSSSEYSGSAPDMGANEFLSVSDCSLLGDLNFDNIINVLDIVMLVNIVLSDDDNICADMNSDGIYNVLDIVLMVNAVLSN